ncbi:rab-GTPase-TBC domain-containing protein [Melanogaster broomeanus]|nr:rab-GTPase-TBC domain-containing protein [Melanogaster broomeanus]
MSEDAERSVFMTTTASAPHPPPLLYSLLSPKSPLLTSVSPRDSLAESDYNDVILEDDPRFSTVPLSERASVASSASDLDEVTTRLERRTTISSAPSKAIASLRLFAHRKSASSVTAAELSAGNILARLGIQNAQDDIDLDVPHSAGVGQQKLHEEFLRLHNERRADAMLSEEGAIDWDFWGAVISDYQGYAAANPEKLAKAIERGIPDTLRGMMWQLMAASKDTELENTYLGLLKETSPHEKAITRDLGRTFPHHEFFTDGQGIGQENLYDPQVGYCQGLPFVVAVLLLNMPDEEAFSLLVRLMHTYDLRGHFLPEMPKLQLRLFDRLIEEVLPVIHLHFVRQGIKSSMFCSQWFLTLFSYRFPLDIVFRIYDNCIASGIEAIFAFSIVLLQKNEDIVSSDEEEDRSERQIKYRVDEFVQDAISLKITPFMLDAYAHDNRALAAKLNTEHVEVLNQLVMARLRNEEMEEELVRYKLLQVPVSFHESIYAEAMHQNEDAMSNNRRSKPQLSSRRGSDNP